MRRQPPRPDWLGENWTWLTPRTNHIIKLDPRLLNFTNYDGTVWLLKRLRETKDLLEGDYLPNSQEPPAKYATIHHYQLPLCRQTVSFNREFIKQLILAMAINDGDVKPGDIISGQGCYIVVAMGLTLQLVALPVKCIYPSNGRTVVIPEEHFPSSKWPAYYWKNLFKQDLVDYIEAKASPSHHIDLLASMCRAAQPELGPVLMETFCNKQAPSTLLRMFNYLSMDRYHIIPVEGEAVWYGTIFALKYKESPKMEAQPTIEFSPISLLAKLKPTCLNSQANRLIRMAKKKYRGYRWLLERMWQLYPPLTRIVLAYC